MKHVKPFESFVNEAKYDKKKLLKAIKNLDDATILVKGKEYIIYNPNSGNDDNAAMWGDKTIVALDPNGDEHEFKYSDIERFSESVINESDWGTYDTPEGKMVSKELNKAWTKFASTVDAAHTEWLKTVQKYRGDAGKGSGFIDSEGRDAVVSAMEWYLEKVFMADRRFGGIDHRKYRTLMGESVEPNEGSKEE